VSTQVYFDGKVYTRKREESVLDALCRGGANVGFSCRKGSCHVCMLQAVDGDPGPDANRGLRPGLARAGMFLPCTAYPSGDLEVQQPDPTALFATVQVASKRWLSNAVCAIQLEPETHLHWRPGQFVNVRRADGLTRSYSVTSCPYFDYFLEIHVKRLSDGAMSRWLCDAVEPGDRFEIQGPAGTCYYDPPEHGHRALVLLATGSGLSPLLGVVKDALRQGHTAPITLYHGSRDLTGLYLRDELSRLATQYEHVRYIPCLTQEPIPSHIRSGRVVDLAFAEHRDLSEAVTFLCGIPDMVYEARYRAVLAGCPRERVLADPFEYAHVQLPTDRERMGRVVADPELWEALDQGPKLMTIIRAFYDEAFEDERLAPFFRRVTKRRAVEKQYSFLADMLTGATHYFGLGPFNAHHWMIISDELFDYRERMFERVVRSHGIPEPMVRRWMALHELFRRDIVKNAARGMVIDGVEQPVGGFEDVVVAVASVCDGCMAEINEGELGHTHARTGELFCVSCRGKVAEVRT